MLLQYVLIGAFFCYGVFTLQRRGFLLEQLPRFWRNYWPESMHEALYSCGICVSSIWGTLFILSQFFINHFVSHPYIHLVNIPFYIVAMCGLNAVIDRAVKYFEYGYKYTSIPQNAEYSYLNNNFEFRDSLYDCFLKEAIEKNIPIVEIGGFTEKLGKYAYYNSYDKANGTNVIGYALPREKFVLVKGIAFEGGFDHLLKILMESSGFVVEGSLSGESGRQLQWILDKFSDVIRLPYSIENPSSTDCPDQCGGSVNNRIVLVKPLKHGN